MTDTAEARAATKGLSFFFSKPSAEADLKYTQKQNNEHFILCPLKANFRSCRMSH